MIVSACPSVINVDKATVMNNIVQELGWDSGDEDDREISEMMEEDPLLLENAELLSNYEYPEVESASSLVSSPQHSQLNQIEFVNFPNKVKIPEFCLNNQDTDDDNTNDSGYFQEKTNLPQNLINPAVQPLNRSLIEYEIDEERDYCESCLGQTICQKFTFTTTQQNRKKLIFHDYAYVVRCQSKTSKTWECETRKSESYTTVTLNILHSSTYRLLSDGGCPVILRTNLEDTAIIAMPNGKHRDNEDCDRKVVGDVIQAMKDRAKESAIVNFHKIFTDITVGLDARVLAKLPNKIALKEVGRRSYYEKFKFPPEPVSLDFEFDEEFFRLRPNLIRISDILRDESESVIRRIEIITSEVNARNSVNSANMWMEDATFLASPVLFYQLFIIHANALGTKMTRPCFFAFATGELGERILII